ncbi:MAG: DinB family protein [Acidobacteriota bacterium]
MEILEGVTSEQAAARPIEGGHNIWELALHIEAWLRACRRRLHAQLSDAEDWPAITAADQQAWKHTRESIMQENDELRSAILLDDYLLGRPIIEGMSSLYVTLHGVVQHSLYHAGQLAILKKAASERQTA